MPSPGHKIHIPLTEKQALNLLLKVKPTGDMPRQGAKQAQHKPKKQAK